MTNLWHPNNIELACCLMDTDIKDVTRLFIKHKQNIERRICNKFIDWINNKTHKYVNLPQSTYKTDKVIDTYHHLFQNFDFLYSVNSIKTIGQVINCFKTMEPQDLRFKIHMLKYKSIIEKYSLLLNI